MNNQLSGSLFLAILFSMLAVGATTEPGGSTAEVRTVGEISRERIEVADEALRLVRDPKRIAPAAAGWAEVLEWLTRQAQAHIDARESAADRRAFLKEYLRTAQEVAASAEEMEEAGLCSRLAVVAAYDYRLEAEMWLVTATGETGEAAANPARTVAQINRERIQNADERCRLATLSVKGGIDSAERMLESFRRQAQARMDSAGSNADGVAILEEYVRHSMDVARSLKEQQEMGRCPRMNALSSQWFALDAEMWLAKYAEQSGKAAEVSRETRARIGRERVQIAEAGCMEAKQRFEAGLAGEETSPWLRRQAQAQIDALDNSADRVAFLEKYWRRSKEIVRVAEARHRARKEPSLTVLAARYSELEAELWLAESKE